MLSLKRWKNVKVKTTKIIGIRQVISGFLVYFLGFVMKKHVGSGRFVASGQTGSWWKLGNGKEGGTHSVALTSMGGKRKKLET